MKKLLRHPWAALMPAAIVLMTSAPAHAQYTFTQPTRSLTTVADTPASTLLIPYFEVDLADVKGVNTIFTIDHTGDYSPRFFMGVPNGVDENAATAMLTHVTIWTDLGIPVFNFDIYLTGFDVETVNLRNILSGVLPRTASAGQDPSDTISPKGPISQDINFASCNGILPLPNLTSTQIATLTYALSGQPIPSQGNMCASIDHGDHIARGYVTVDIMNSCFLGNAGDPGYFGPGGSGRTTTQNGLTGSIFYVDPNHHVARSINAVHIHGDPTNPLVNTPGNYTFYGRFSNFMAYDQRQPLPTTFLARYASVTTTGVFAPATNIGSSLIVWRDIKVPQQTFFACGFTPTWYPMRQEGLAVFDEQEHIQQINSINAFPLATQQVAIGAAGLPVTFPSGWLYLDLNTVVPAALAVGDNIADSAATQGWVQVIEKLGFTQFVSMHNAQQLDSATQPNHFVP